MMNAIRMMNSRNDSGLPLPLAGEGWGGGAISLADARAPTRRASLADLPRKRER